MGKKIDTLSEDHFRTWHNICRWMWVHENVKSDEINVKDALETYDLHIEFLKGCIEEYDIDETKPWTVSNVTGDIYYTEE